MQGVPIRNPPNIEAPLARAGHVFPAQFIDRSVARELSGKIVESNRLAFAQSFTLAVMRAWQRASIVPDQLLRATKFDVFPLSGEASHAAESLGSTLTNLNPRIAAHFVGVIYTTALPEAYRASHGIFYTPPQIVDRLLAMPGIAHIDWAAARVLDPSCGGGAFLLPIAQRMAAAMAPAKPHFILQQIGVRLRGFELDPFGAWLAQAGLELVLQDIVKAAGRPAPMIVDIKDSLAMDAGDNGRFDLVVGNPPYGRVSPPLERRALFKRSLYGHANLYGLFTDAALHWTKPGGVIGYVTPTSMLSGLYYKALRRLLATAAPPLAVEFVSERDDVFADVLQETMLATYRRGRVARTGKVGFLAISAAGDVSSRQAGTFALPKQPDAPWLLPRSPEQVALTRRLRAMPHRLADYGYGVSTGPLVWNRFKDQFCDSRKAGAHPVIWAESVTSAGRFLWRSEKRSHMPWFKAQRPKDDWLIVRRPCVLLQRTTAKEQARRLIAAELPISFIEHHRGVIVENHLNMVRAITPDPVVPASVIAVLLNSWIVDAAFRCINGSVAVSAFELEALPLPAPPLLAKLVTLLSAGAPTKTLEAVIAAAYAGRDASTAS